MSDRDEAKGAMPSMMPERLRLIADALSGKSDWPLRSQFWPLADVMVTALRLFEGETTPDELLQAVDHLITSIQFERTHGPNPSM